MKKAMGRIFSYGIILLAFLSVGCIIDGGDEGTADRGPSQTVTSPEKTPGATSPTEPSAVEVPFEDPPEFVDLQWVNSEPLRIADQQGKVVMIEFWNRLCTRCQRIHPKMLEYHNKYSSEGLVIIALHVPAVPDDKDPDLFKGRVEELNIEHPVALDNNYENWNNYGVEYTGTFFLIDKSGKVRYMVGIGTYETLEDRIKELLAE